MNPRAAYSMLHAIVTPSLGRRDRIRRFARGIRYAGYPDAFDGSASKAGHYALHTRILWADDAYTDEQKKLIPPAVWPIGSTLIRAQVCKVLFVGVHARQIIGMSTAESRLLISDLLEHATQRERIYTHKWEVGDLVMWDNRATVHRGAPLRPQRAPRIAQRTTVRTTLRRRCSRWPRRGWRHTFTVAHRRSPRGSSSG